MNLTTIEMSREEAEAALAEWGDVVKTKKCEPEDAAIAEGYKALAEGHQLIALSETIATGGEDELHRPRLAVAPAKSTQVYLDRHQNGTVRFTTSQQPGQWSRDVTSRGVILPEVLPKIEYGDRTKLSNWSGACFYKAMTPVVPPRFRSWGWKGSYILFEAEWARDEPPAPVDPALIRHLRGDLWVVRGVWDLTDLERAVLMERNRD